MAPGQARRSGPSRTPPTDRRGRPRCCMEHSRGLRIVPSALLDTFLSGRGRRHSGPGACLRSALGTPLRCGFCDRGHPGLLTRTVTTVDSREGIRRMVRYSLFLVTPTRAGVRRLNSRSVVGFESRDRSSHIHLNLQGEECGAIHDIDFLEVGGPQARAIIIVQHSSSVPSLCSGLSSEYRCYDGRAGSVIGPSHTGG